MYCVWEIRQKKGDLGCFVGKSVYTECLKKAKGELSAKGGNTMNDLMGQYSYKVDVKGRVALPPKFAKELSKELIVTLNPEKTCLLLFEPEDFNDWVKRFFEGDGGFQQSNPRHEKIRSVLKGRAKEIETDSAGRINIPSDQRELAGIRSTAVFIGNTGYIEIWDPQAREAFESDIDLAALLYGAAE